MSDDQKRILEFLHKCLDPYLPPIISDSNQSLELIAKTIDEYYKFRNPY